MWSDPGLWIALGVSALFIVVGVVMPFSDSGWKLTNTALLAIVLAETVRDALMIAGYRRRPRLAH